MAESVETSKQQNTVEVPQQTNAKEKGWSYRGGNLKLTFDMQIELARRFYGLSKTAERGDLDDIVFRWVDSDGGSNSKKFREFVEANPSVVDLFKRDPEAALLQVEHSIYETHGT